MTSSGLPELTGSQDLKYMFDALQPHNTDAEATIFFTRYFRGWGVTCIHFYFIFNINWQVEKVLHVISQTLG